MGRGKGWTSWEVGERGQEVRSRLRHGQAPGWVSWGPSRRAAGYPQGPFCFILVIHTIEFQQGQ